MRSWLGKRKHAPTEFHKYIQDLFLENTLAPAVVQQLAVLAGKHRVPGVQRLAAAGSAGRRPGNLRRDMLRTVLQDCRVPELYMAEIPVRGPKGECTRRLWPFLLPHEFLPQMVETVGLDAATTWPEELGALRERVGAAARSLELDVSHLLAVGIHGDGVASTPRQLCNIISYNLANRPGDDRFLFSAIDKRHMCPCGCKGRCSIDAMLSVFVWSMRCLLAGVYPSEGPRQWTDGQHTFEGLPERRAAKGGTPLGVCALLCQSRGDWAWNKYVFDFPSWSSSGRMCWMCLADSGGNDWKDFSCSAAWRGTTLSHSGYLLACAMDGVRVSPLFGAPGFSLSAVVVDLMHIGDLGISQDLVGNVLHSVSTQIEGDKPIKMSTLRDMLCTFYKKSRAPSQLPKLEWESFALEQRPYKLRSKAAECRYLVPWAVELTTLFLTDTPYHRTRWQCADALLRFYNTMAITPFAADAAQSAAIEHLQSYANLKQMSADPRAWVIKPKHHCFAHLGSHQVQEIGCPSLFWCYLDEDFIGRLGRAGQSRGGPATPANIVSLLQCYRAWLSN